MGNKSTNRSHNFILTTLQQHGPLSPNDLVHRGIAAHPPITPTHIRGTIWDLIDEKKVEFAKDNRIKLKTDNF